MKDYRKTFLGSLIVFFIGTSCCWLSTLAIWIGGASIISVIVAFVENVQTQLIMLSVFLFATALYQIHKRKKRALK